MRKGNDAAKIEERVEELLKQMTLEEKTQMIHGTGFFHSGEVKRLSIPPVMFSDGPMGVRQEFLNDKWIPKGYSDDFVSYLPSNSALASTWSRELAAKTGEILGREARGRGKDMILAPGINIKRSPLCGRNFEYMSEDPKLIEEITVPFIRGIQKSDVSACVKHYAANAQETDRLMVDTIVDERALRELYLPGFKAAVEKAGTYSLMCAYNKVNGWHCSENKELLDHILRQEWGFDGTIVSDWGAVHRTKEAAEVSLDVEMSVTGNFDEYYFADPLLEAVQKGEISERVIDDKVRNLLRMMFRLKMIGEKRGERCAGTYNVPEHREGIYQTAAQAVILLKNEEKLLPLEERNCQKIAVIGRNAEMLHAPGGGSGEIKALYEISPLMGIKMRLGGNAKVMYAPGYFVPEKEQEDENWQADSIELGVVQERQDEAYFLEKERQQEIARREGQRLSAEALELVKECDQVIFVGGLNHDCESEGMDRSDMRLPYGQDALVEAILKVKPDTVIVMVAGSPVEMPWEKKAKAILWTYYAGMETGLAVSDVLFGRVNPSGRLAETFPVSYEDTPTAENGQFGLMGRVEFKESVFVGYRYYEARKRKPLFCFGHGLSYTEFSYDRIEIVEESNHFTVEVTITNIGKRAGWETVQLYTGEETPTVERPIKELKGFDKVFLAPGEQKALRFLLSERDFGYYDVGRRSFHANKGVYRISVGASCEDIRLVGKVLLSQDYDYR